MSKQTEALKLALEALSPWAGEDANHTEQYAAYHAIREALAEQETVFPGGGHVPAVPVAVYGYCPECGGAGVMRERRPNGDDKCTNGHKYPSSKALAEQPAHQEPYGWHTEDHLTDRSATTYRKDVADRWKSKGWPVTPLYTSPQSKSWVHATTWRGLTDEEWQEIDASLNGKRDLARIFVRAIEAALRSKNT